MFSSRLSFATPLAARAFSASARANSKVAVLGAAGGIGQPLSLLLKYEPSISHLALFDIVNTPGVAADIGHIDTPAKVTGHIGDAELQAAVENAEVVVIPAGVPRKPGMTRDDLFNTNATIVAKLAEGVAKWAPKAAVLVIANPVNSTVPIVAEVFKKYGVYDERKIFGVTTLDIVRANNFVKELKNAWNDKRDVKVVGGHSGVTILPLLSQTGYEFTPEEVEKLTHRIQFGGDEVVKAKAGTGSATLSMAHAGARFTVNVLHALKGVPHIQDIGFVYHGAAKPKSDIPHPQYFASEIKLGTEGVKEILPVGKLSEFEKTKLAAAIPELEGNIAKGVDFVKKFTFSK